MLFSHSVDPQFHLQNQAILATCTLYYYLPALKNLSPVLIGSLRKKIVGIDNAWTLRYFFEYIIRQFLKDI